MGKILKLFVAIFAIIGVASTGIAGYTYATNPELVKEFWSVKDDIKHVPAERHREVVSELPARIIFEREVRDDMVELPEERQTELYQQLEESRRLVFERFKERIANEAAVARTAKEAQKDVTSEIESRLGRVNVDVDLSGGRTTAEVAPPRQDPLLDVNRARRDVVDARQAYGAARESSTDTSVRASAAVDVLKALDRLGDEVQKVDHSKLNQDERSRLDEIIRDARATLMDMRQTPGLRNDPEAGPLLDRVGGKLTTR
jgi:hypothetical protein